MGHFENFSKKLKDAILHDDVAALSAMGKAGAAKKAERKEMMEATDEIYKEKATAQQVTDALDKAKHISEENGEILPPDPKTVDGLEGLKRELDN